MTPSIPEIIAEWAAAGIFAACAVIAVVAAVIFCQFAWRTWRQP